MIFLETCCHIGIKERRTILNHCSSVFQKIVFVIACFFLFSTGMTCEAARNNPDDGLNKEASSNTALGTETQQPRVVVYYFHGTVRCSTCIKIQVLTVAAVKEGFASEIKNGKVQVKALDIDEEPNKHFKTDYRLESKSVIVSQLFGETEKQWKNLDKIWDYVNDEKKFMEYIKTEVKKYL